ncbi:MAG: hypothetical protein H6558_19555 [Lewinellaceae bacterium]|nr:hypothetical protein [Lewinellaceae bacterium]
MKKDLTVKLKEDDFNQLPIRMERIGEENKQGKCFTQKEKGVTAFSHNSFIFSCGRRRIRMLTRRSLSAR